MPADARAGPVFIDQHLREGLGGLACQRRDLVAQGQQEVRDRRGLDHLAPIVVVAQAKTHDAPVCQMAMEIERLERQASEMPGEFGFFLRGDKIRLVEETFRQVVGGTKEIVLEPG